MADVPDTPVNDASCSSDGNVESKEGSESVSHLEFNLEDLFSNIIVLNPLVDEFIPSSNSSSIDDPFDLFTPSRRRNKYSQGRRRLTGIAFKAQNKDRIKRTVYVSDIDHNVTEDQLAALFSAYGHILDCRVCGDPHARLRFAFVEFADENSARSALDLCGMMLGFSQIMVSPSKTAILPVNSSFLPKSEDEKEMCARTVYCTNIDKKVSQGEVKNFFEARCGEVSHIRLLGDRFHPQIAFVEFMTAASAIMALDCCGQTLGTRPIRPSPSKTPVSRRVARSPPTN